jgi:hypothetical protein
MGSKIGAAKSRALKNVYRNIEASSFFASSLSINAAATRKTFKDLQDEMKAQLLFEQHRMIKQSMNEGKARAKANSRLPQNWIIQSSWVKALGYDKKTKILYAALGDSEMGKPVKDYYWQPVGELIYIVWRAARSRCKTYENKKAGRHGSIRTVSRRAKGVPLQRWEPGKTPSLGATWWYTVGRQLAGKAI